MGSLKAVYQWVLRTMMKSKGETGIVQTMPKKDLVELNTQITAQRLMQNGINPESLKNADQVENAIIAIESRPKVQEGIKSTKSAKIMDMEGKEIPPGAKIMGGKATETEAEVLARMNKENKESVARIKNKKIVKDAIDNASPGFVKGDRKYNAQLVADDLAEKKFGKDFYDLDQRQQMDLYDEALEGLSEDFAQGGRAGFKIGGIDKARRAFLKAAAGVSAGIGALKTGLLGLSKKTPEATQKVMENFSSTASEAPGYFFDLVTKIKMFGKKSKFGPQERIDEYSYIGKNGDQYTLTEDIVTGDAQIVKDKMGIGSYGDKTFDTINDRTVLEYKAPKKDVDPDTQRFTDEAAEYEEYRVEFDPDGTQAGADAIDESIQKEIIEEATKEAPSIKKAGGGIARMLGE